MTIDFLTTIIDNYWDAWFAFNLALSLSEQKPKIEIRFFCDNHELYLKLKWGIDTKNIEYFDLKDFEKSTPSPIIFNFFDRKINFDFLHSFEYPITLINFTYFLMHIGVRSLHHTHYISKNVSVTHYIPSLLPEGGGVIIHPEIERYKEEIEKNGIIAEKRKFFPHFDAETLNKKWVSLFCYPDTFQEISQEILKDSEHLYFVFDYDIQWENIINMPFLDIISYQKFLFLCDKNIVRWENSLVWAILSGKPFLWDIYKEHNGAHKEKIDDFQEFLTHISVNDFYSYNQIFFDFNIWENKSQAFSWFIALQQDKLFMNISEKVYLENNLIKNLENLV